MATKSKTAQATPRRALTRAQTSTSPAPDPAALVESAPPAQQQALQALSSKPTSSEEMVTVVIPKDFTLTLDDQTLHPYPAGVQEMPRSHASHWFSKAQGVVEYKGKA